MRRYKVTFLVANSTVINAVDMQAAHNEVTKILINSSQDGGNSTPILQGIEDIGPVQDDFDYPPPAA